MKCLSLTGALAAAVGVLSTASGVAASPPDGATKAAIDSMNKYYNQTDGRWGTAPAWWLSGIAFQNAIDYMVKTGTQDYLDKVEHTFEIQKAPVDWWPEGGGNFRADSTDDTAWWAMALVNLYDLTKDEQYLDIAKQDEEYIWKYWINGTCDGGLIWNIPNKEYKNAIGNEQYIKLLAMLHNRIPGDKEYVQRAISVWEWFRDSGLINGDHLINDGLAENDDGTCTNNGQTTWTYNQGVILGALTELHAATDNEEYLTAAKEIADAVVNSDDLSPGGILKEPCDANEGCKGDQAAFKGIFMKNLAEFNTALDDHPYGDYLTANADSAYNNARNGTDFYSVAWEGPLDEFTIGSQTSGVNVLLAVM